MDLESIKGPCLTGELFMNNLFVLYVYFIYSTPWPFSFLRFILVFRSF